MTFLNDVEIRTDVYLGHSPIYISVFSRLGSFASDLGCYNQRVHKQIFVSLTSHNLEPVLNIYSYMSILGATMNVVCASVTCLTAETPMV